MYNVKNGSPFITSKSSSKNLSNSSVFVDFQTKCVIICQFSRKSGRIECLFSLLRFFDELFDVINGDPFLTLYKTSAVVHEILSAISDGGLTDGSFFGVPISS